MKRIRKPRAGWEARWHGQYVERGDGRRVWEGQTCGHVHRTSEAAGRCLDRHIGTDCGGAFNEHVEEVGGEV